jgi:predicted RNA-binding Zn ribbon-like protein
VARQDPRRATGPLAVVQDLVNTAHRLHGADALATPAMATTALVDLGLLDDRAHVDAAGRQRLIALREALRALLVARAERRDPAAAAAALDGLSAAVPVRIRVTTDGRPVVAPASGAGAADRVAATVLAAIAAAHAEGRWERLKACANEDCRWAFADASRNRSARWCDMDVCGARHKMRAYRERHR